MEVLVPANLAEVHDGLRRSPGSRLLAGGTDLLVELRATDSRPPAILSIGQVPELQGWRRHNGRLDLGAGTTLTDLADRDLDAIVPALAAAARCVAGPQIRNAATLGGNLATAAPTSDLIPVLTAIEATVTVVGPDGSRNLRVGSAEDTLEPAEIVVAVHVPLRRCRQTYLRTGPRNGMALPLAAVALVVDIDERQVRCAVGGSGRAVEAEQWVGGHVDWSTGRIPDPRTYGGFGQLVAEHAVVLPAGPVPSDYRRHAIRVLARRALMGLM